MFVETQYDFAGRVKATSNPYRQGDVIYWSKPRYDEIGRTVESFAPAQTGQGASLGVTSYSISTVTNFVGTVVTTTDASGRKERSITNALGQLLRVDEPQNTGGTIENDLGTLSSPLQPTFYKYNVQGKMVEVEQGAQKRNFKYDSLGRLIRVRQPEQEINPNINLNSSDPYNTSGQWTAAFSYDMIGNVKRATDANGVNIIYEYDKANRVTKRCYTKPNFQTSATQCSQISGNESGNTSAVEYFYDGIGFTSLPVPNTAKGKLTRVVSCVSETRYAMFDEFGRLTQSQQITDGQTYQSSYEYNFSGALVKQTYPNGRVVENAFESDGDLAKIYGKANVNAIERTYANSFSYTPDGRIEKLKLGNHRWEWAKFNERLQVTELNLGSGVNDASLWKLKYDYGEIDNNNNVIESKNTGNIARMTTSFNGLAHPFVQSFKYDSLYRLTEARETSNSQQTWKQNFSYDRYGNRTNYVNFVGTNQQTLDNKTHPSIDPLTNRFNEGPSYIYDFNGNLISDAENRQFTFNGDNKQTEIKVNNEPIGRYFYDGEGKRVKKITNLETVIFVYDGLGKMVAEYTTKEPPTNPTTSFTATDMLGSPRVITDSNGNVTSRRDFQPFGEELSPNGVNRTVAQKYGSTDGIRQKFTSYQRDDETLLDFAEARMYENRHARFTAVDPLLASGKSADPQTFNRYVYVMNNPLVRTDPTGLQTATHPERPEGAEIWINVYINEIYNAFADVFRDRTNHLLYGDSLDRVNYQRAQTRIKAATGDPESMNELSRTLLPGQGATVDSMIQGITDARTTGYEIGKANIEFQFFWLTANPVSQGMFSNSSAGSTGRDPQPTDPIGRAFLRAETAKEAFKTNNPDVRRAMIVGAADTKSRLSAADVNGDIPEVVGPLMRANADKAGGLGYTVPGTRMCVGRCAEFRVSNTLELKGANPNNLVFTRPERFRPTGGFRPVCFLCQTWTTPSQFPFGTELYKW